MTVNAAESEQTQSRKADHLRICLEDDVEFRELGTGLERYHFRHCCLPELDLGEIDLRTWFFGKSLQAPFLISSMTGGTEAAKLINQRLAEVAQAQGLAMGVGSQRVAVENPALSHTFDVRSLAPGYSPVCQSWGRSVELWLWGGPMSAGDRHVGSRCPDSPY